MVSWLTDLLTLLPSLKSIHPAAIINLKNKPALVFQLKISQWFPSLPFTVQPSHKTWKHSSRSYQTHEPDLAWFLPDWGTCFAKQTHLLCNILFTKFCSLGLCSKIRRAFPDPVLKNNIFFKISDVRSRACNRDSWESHLLTECPQERGNERNIIGQVKS